MRQHLGVSVGAAVVTLTVVLLIVGVRAANRNGLNRSVYTQVGFAGEPSVADVTTSISLEFLARNPMVTGLNFGARWEGFWYVPESRVIELHARGDDRLDVWLDGELVIRRAPPGDMHAISRTLVVDAGVREILIEYEQFAGRRALSLGWALPGRRPRPFAAHRLFHERPTMVVVRLAEREFWLAQLALPLWVATVLLGGVLSGGALTNRGQGKSRGALRGALVHGALLLCVTVTAIRAAIARLPGWDPDSLWMDDLIYGTLIRADFWSMLTIPIHVAPGLFLIWRALYASFPDPEWSLQVLPFACGVASIPVMALVVWNLTRDEGLALLAAAATALNPLLAHYSVFVHQYSLDFLVTALFLLAATVLFRRRRGRAGAPVWPVALAGGLATFLSVPSVFVSFPLLHLAVLSALRDWHRTRSRGLNALLSVAAYDLAVFGAYLFMSGRANEHVRRDFAAGFLPLDSAGAMWEFLASNGRFLLDMSLPDLGVPPWPLPLVGLGLAWLLARRSTRLIGLLVLSTYGMFGVASGLRVYPLGTGRPDIFAFPLAILLSVMGVHLATVRGSYRRVVRWVLALGLAAFALVHPLHVEYRGEADQGNGKLLIDHLVAGVRADDGLILMPGSEYLTAFYGPWPYALAVDERVANATRLTLGRGRTLHLGHADADIPSQVERYLSSRPDRIWVISFWRGQHVNGILERHGYAVHVVETILNGGLYLALDHASRSNG